MARRTMSISALARCQIVALALTFPLMKHLVILLLVALTTVLAASAQSPDEQFVRVYNLIQQADALRNNGRSDEALPKYLEANTTLNQIKRTYPEWQPRIVDFRLSYLQQRIEAITGAQPIKSQPVAPATTPAPRPSADQAAPAPAVESAAPANTELHKQLLELQESVRRLQAERQVLEAKLKEAFATQPATVDPREFAKAQERIQTLLKENELLKAGLESEKNRPAPAANTKELEEARAALAEANNRLSEQRATTERITAEKNALQERLGQLTSSAAMAEALRAENELLKKQLTEARNTAAQAGTTAQASTEAAKKLAEAEARLAAMQSDVEVLRLEKIALEERLKHAQAEIAAAKTLAPAITPVPTPAPVPTPTPAPAPVASTSGSRETDLAKIRELERQRDVLRKRLDEANLQLHTGEGRRLNERVQQLTREVAQLKARVEVFEAKAVPYTLEELALFQKPAVKPAPTPVVETNPMRRTSRDLPVNTVNLLAQAEKHFANKDYDKAEENYRAILQQDNNSAVTLANLAAIQMEQGRLAEAEKNLERALELSPNDPHSVSLLGYLKFRQEKYDDAIEALNRAAKLNPQNADVQNYLGVTLSQKGLRGPAEQAFRRAVVLNPAHGGAHNNLAVFYASENPPNIPLARFHYQKALAAGHPQNPELEQLLARREASSSNK